MEGGGAAPGRIAPAPRPLVSLRGVEKRYAGGTLALRGVDLDIGRGDFLSLLGPSGCGKSTLLRILAGLTGASAGTLDWPPAAHDARGRRAPRLGFVFQEPTLMPWATALANAALPLRLEGVARSERESRAAEALARVGLAGFERAYPRALSGGMKMRVSIARALVTRPDILLMDEPFAALDEITRFRLNNDLLEIWQEAGFTVVFVTHSVFESVYLSRRIAVMAARPGRIETEIAVPASYPRGEAFRTSAEYAAICRTVSLALAEAIAA
jgi:NitT/TauT family transport system ATP-binding protein